MKMQVYIFIISERETCLSLTNPNAGQHSALMFSFDFIDEIVKPDFCNKLA